MNLLIADSDPEIATYLTNNINLKELGLCLVGVAIDSIELQRLIKSAAPDIVIMDISEFDGFAIISQTRHNYPNCRFIMMSKQKQFEYAYNALKWKVDAYLLKPIDIDELNGTLECIKQETTLSKKYLFRNEGKDIIGTLFFEMARNEFSLKPISVERINSIMGTKFNSDSFRICNIKFDFFDDTMPGMNLIMSMQNRCIEMIRSMLHTHCHDILFTNDPLMCRALVNCSIEKDEQLKHTLELCLIKIKNTMLITNSMDVTFGISLPFQNLANTYVAIREAREAIWLRFSHGAGQIIYWVKEQKLSAYYEKLFENFEQNLKRACSLLDIDEFADNINQFFSLPQSVLICKETRTLISRVENYMYEVNRDLISSYSDVEKINNTIRDDQRKASTLEKYRDSYVLNMTSLFQEISARAPKNCRAVRQAQYYVKENLGTELSLHVVAGQVGLSPIYFSSLFKKKTGENFTDYVNSRRIDAAKVLLAQNSIKISEVSNLTGFTNSKYFSKIFKQREDITPSEFRKKHNGGQVYIVS